MDSSKDSREREDAAPATSWAQRSGSYAFLNHSSTTLPNNLPPSVDDKPLARQKRRRTSPEDQAVLEAAYSQDFKPDKAARLELTKQVALGEKEVQIWFQNRRQTSRRKSRPLLPHEIAQYHLARNGLSDQGSFLEPSSDPELDPTEDSLSTIPPTGSDQIYDQYILRRSCTSDSETCRANLASSPEPSQISCPIIDSTAASHDQSGPLGHYESPSLPVDSNFSNGYSANRRSEASMRMHDPQSTHVSSVPFGTHNRPASYLKKASSSVRLSLTRDGHAKLVTNDESSPSPPRLPQLASELFGLPSGAQINPTVSLIPHDAAAMKPIQRSSSGRSRDSRTWEFYCDRETRSELEDKAEKDASGSAADAIDLLRSNSGRRILGQLSSRNMNVLPKSWRRNRLDPRSRPLHRSSTSLGRLQNNPKSDGTERDGPQVKKKAYKHDTSTYIPGNESDKENWSPGSARQAVNSREPHMDVANASSKQREEPYHARALGRRSKSHASSFATDLARRSDEDGENIDPHLNPDHDPEIAAFMRSARSESTSREDDLDCIQGLLSLSQGNWR